MKYKIGDVVKLKSFQQLKKINKKMGANPTDDILMHLSNARVKIWSIKKSGYEIEITNNHGLFHVFEEEIIGRTNILIIPEKMFEL